MDKRKNTLVFFKSSLCPRCMLVRKELSRLQKKFPELAVVEIDVLSNPLQLWRNGIRLIPAMQSGEEILAGLFLGAEEIRQFVTNHLVGTTKKSAD